MFWKKITNGAARSSILAADATNGACGDHLEDGRPEGLRADDAVKNSGVQLGKDLAVRSPRVSFSTLLLSSDRLRRHLRSPFLARFLGACGRRLRPPSLFFRAGKAPPPPLTGPRRHCYHGDGADETRTVRCERTEELRRKRNQTKFSEAPPRRRGRSHAQSNHVWTTA